MQTTQPATPEPTLNTAAENPDLDDAIRNYMRAYALWHGRLQAVRLFCVSRQTLWCFSERVRLGRSLAQAVVETVDDDPDAIAAASTRLQVTGRDSGECPVLPVSRVGNDS